MALLTQSQSQGCEEGVLLSSQDGWVLGGDSSPPSALGWLHVGSGCSHGCECCSATRGSTCSP